MYKQSEEFKAIATVRALGADVTEELDAFRLARQLRRQVEVEVDAIFSERGWK